MNRQKLADNATMLVLMLSIMSAIFFAGYCLALLMGGF